MIAPRITRRQALVGIGGAALVILPAQADDFSEVAAPIATLDDALVALMRTPSDVPFDRRFKALAPAVDRAFNLPVILQTCVGARWATLPAPEQTDLLAAFRAFTIATYLANFRSYSGERFEIIPPLRPVGGGGRIVATRLVPRVGDPTRLDYVMRPSDEGWQAVDVLLGGTISRVAVQRSDFRALLASGETPALIASLRRKVADIAAGRG